MKKTKGFRFLNAADSRASLSRKHAVKQCVLDCDFDLAHRALQPQSRPRREGPLFSSVGRYFIEWSALCFHDWWPVSFSLPAPAPLLAPRQGGYRYSTLGSRHGRGCCWIRSIQPIGSPASNQPRAPQQGRLAMLGARCGAMRRYRPTLRTYSS